MQKKIIGLGVLLLVLIVLGGENIYILYRHYFNGVVFPDDFLLTYYAVPYYWIEALKQGKSISWIPYQGMGYPLFMNMQSGEFYPPLIFFAWFQQTYTLYSAVILQGLHILLGALGATICARLVGARWLEALLAGVFYQCFGGFYSNAQHPDIVRSFAFLPWLLGPVFARWRPFSGLLKFSIVSLPVWVYAQWTGGYAGGTLAVLMVMGIICSVRMICDRTNSSIAISIFIGFVAGSLAAAMLILPAAMFAGEVDRYREPGSIAYDYMNLRDAFSFVFPTNNEFFDHDPSMRSMFIGIPAFAMILMAFRRYGEEIKWLSITVGVALLMATGPLHQLIIKILPIFGLSRFVMADYRGIICLSLILICTSMLRNLSGERRLYVIWPAMLVIILLSGFKTLDFEREYAIEDRIAEVILITSGLFACFQRISIRLGDWTIEPLLFISAFGLYMYADYISYVSSVPHKMRLLMYLGLALVLLINFLCAKLKKISIEPIAIIAIGLLILHGVYLFYVARPYRNGEVIPVVIIGVVTMIALSPTVVRTSRVLFIALLMVMGVMDWTRVQWDQRYFAPPVSDGTPWVESVAGKFSDTQPALSKVLVSEECRKEARLDVPFPLPNMFPWSGYYTGRYFLQDYSGPIKFARQKMILASAPLRKFAMRPWGMFEAKDNKIPSSIETDSQISARCVYYGTSSAEYMVKLNAARLVVENEIYWKGWTAQLLCDKCGWDRNARLVEAVEIQGFRGWYLPAGEYRMVERFDTPYESEARLISLFGIMVWLGLIWFICKYKGPGEAELASN